MKKIDVIIQAINYSNQSIQNRSILKINGDSVLGYIIKKIKKMK